MFSEYTVESFDDIEPLTDYISITLDKKSAGYDTQQIYEGVLLEKSYAKNGRGYLLANTFNIALAAYDAFSDTCYGPINLYDITVGTGYKSHVELKVLDKANPEIKERFNKVSAWIAAN